MSEFTIYHNPRCSKSRQTLGLLEENGLEPRVVLYLETPPPVSEIGDLLGKLGIGAHELIRSGEAIYKEKGLSADLPESTLIEAMANNPVLIERPIVVKGDRAVLGRPPENVLDLMG